MEEHPSHTNDAEQSLFRRAATPLESHPQTSQKPAPVKEIDLSEPLEVCVTDNCYTSGHREVTIPLEQASCCSLPVNTGNQMSQEKPQMTLKNPPRNLWRLLINCCWYCMLGMGDGVLGALLPYIEDDYNISYAIVSLVWMGNAVGFIIIAFTAHLLDEKLGLALSLMSSCGFMTIMYAIVSSGTAFPAIVVGFFFGGLGGAMGLSQLNIFTTKFENGAKYLGYSHGMYGAGAFLSPLIATGMVNAGIPWHYFYLVMLGMSIFCLIGMSMAYKGCEEDLKQFELSEHETARQTDPENGEDMELASISSRVRDGSAKVSEVKHDFKAALQDYRSWAICIFIFFYQGAEVSMGGWMVTFLLNYRGGDETSTGYVASGYWAGITVGRFLLTHRLMSWVGCRRSIIVLGFVIMGLDIVAWFVPSNIASAICAAFVGVAIGPVYTMAVSLAARILPRKIRFCALTLVTAFGSSGGSIVPFTVGMASRFVGTYVLHPVFLTCLAGMIASWLVLPNIERTGALNTIWKKIW